ncbi:MAG: transporter [Burkholderiaceae bacterium]|nr:transporter [Burkholderiaceae bacterium]
MMQKAIRRKDRASSDEEARNLMTNCAYGVLATADLAAQPYAVPLSYVFREHAIYFHCANEGHKLDNLNANPAVSFCVVGQTRVLPDMFSTEYESAIAFGSAHKVEGSEKEEALLLILEKYAPGFITQGKQYLAARLEQVTVFRIDVQRLSGKARR